MPLDKPIEQIAEADLRALIENKVAERKTIEYKQTLPRDSDGDKKEFLADVSSFANASGGHLVYGMREEAGLPAELRGVELEDADVTVRRLDSAIRDGIRTRIPGFVVWPAPMETRRTAIVIRIPKSFASPHMVTFGGASRFFARNSNGKYQLDLDEIRAAFLLSETIAERIRNFRLDRIAKIQAEETPVPLPPGARLVLHVVPLGAFSADNRLEPRILYALHPDRFPLFPLVHHGWQGQGFNFEGLYRYHEGVDRPFASGYLQIFRNGVLEAVNSSLLKVYEGRKRIPSILFEEAILKAAGDYIRSLQRLQVEPPMALMLTLLGVSGYSIGYSQGFDGLKNNSIDRDALLVPELMVESLDVDLTSAMKQVFDIVWNAAGWERSMCYDDKGARKKGA